LAKRIGFAPFALAEDHEVVRVLAEVDDLDRHLAGLQAPAGEVEEPLVLRHLHPLRQRGHRGRGEDERGRDGREGGERECAHGHPISL
jgi:hypothetical protein